MKVVAHPWWTVPMQIVVSIGAVAALLCIGAAIAAFVDWVARMRFFCGLHQPSDAKHFDAAFVSVNRLRDRKSPFAVVDWIMDSGAFTEISTHGRYRHEVAEYAAQIRRWKDNGNLLAAVSRDFMCEPWIIEKTGLSVAEHQRLTIEQYDALLAEDTGVYIMPVLQGYEPDDYARHLEMYGSRLSFGMWVGVGSVCKRNGDPASCSGRPARDQVRSSRPAVARFRAEDASPCASAGEWAAGNRRFDGMEPERADERAQWE